MPNFLYSETSLIQLGGAHNCISEYNINNNIGYSRPHPLYCPQLLQGKIERISCPVEGGARIKAVRIREVRL